MKTIKPIEYHPAGGIKKILIPANTPVIPADNLPYHDMYWCEPWEGMSAYARCWHRNYGFLLNAFEVYDDETV